MKFRRVLVLLVTLSLAFSLPSCANPGAGTATPGAPSATPVPATPTPEPAAVMVNGQPIYLADYEAELQRFNAAMTELGKTVSPEDARQRVLDELIGEELLAQAARSAGQSVDDSSLQARIDSLAEEIGGTDALAGWMEANFYTEAGFRRSLRRAMEAAWQRDTIAAAVPDTADQVHARQIFFLDGDAANTVYAELQAGADFTTLAWEYEPVTGGDLGWFVPGYLTQPEVDSAVFALQPGEYSTVIASQIGYHIVYLIERDAAHPAVGELKIFLQHQAVQAWVTSRIESGTIEIRV